MSIANLKVFKGTKFERSASLYFLLAGIFGLLFTSTSFTLFEKKQANFSKFDGFATSYLLAEKPKTEQATWRNQTAANASVQPFDFDPNTATKEDFLQLGLSAKIASTIQNFRVKNGRFYQASDLKKIYGFREEDYQRLEDYIKIPTINSSLKGEINIPQNEDNQAVAVLFDFNPNEVSVEDFLKLGLSKKLAQRIVNYREKGGRFYKKEDLKKIYDVTEETYARLEQYIQIPKEIREENTYPTTFAKKDFSTEKPAHPDFKIDINQATIEDWQRLKGIGAGYAKKIVGFREKLGGFANVGQIAEIYNFPDSIFQKIQPFLIKESPIYTKINLNQATEEELKSHPYFSWKQAKAVTNYRKQHGNFNNFDDLKKIIGAFKEADWQKIKPYVEF